MFHPSQGHTRAGNEALVRTIAEGCVFKNLCSLSH
jgi:hypothetical protein